MTSTPKESSVRQHGIGHSCETQIQIECEVLNMLIRRANGLREVPILNCANYF